MVDSLVAFEVDAPRPKSRTLEQFSLTQATHATHGQTARRTVKYETAHD